MTRSEKWADGPFALLETPSAKKNIDDHPAHYIANEMAFVHNGMIRGLYAIHLQANHISTADVPDFLFFVATWSDWVLDHHSLETNMFPSFEAIAGIKPGHLSQNVEQHHLFSGRLESLRKSVTGISPAEYDGKKVCELLDGSVHHFRQHLVDEIETLWSLDCCDEVERETLLKVYRSA